MALSRIRIPQIKTGGTAGFIYDDASSILIKKCNWIATTAPAAGNDNTQGYAVGSWWYDTTGKQSYTCVDAATGAAVWRQVSSTDSLSNLTAGTLATDLVVSSSNKITLNSANTSGRVGRINAFGGPGGSNALMFGYASTDYLSVVAADNSGFAFFGFFCYQDGASTKRSSGTLAPSRITGISGGIYLQTAAAGTVDTAISWNNTLTASASGITIAGNATGSAIVAGGAAAGGRFARLDATAPSTGYNDILWGYSSTYQCSFGSGSGSAVPFMGLFCYHGTVTSQMNRSNATNTPSQWKYNGSNGQVQYQYAAVGTADSAITWLPMLDFTAGTYLFYNGAGTQSLQFAVDGSGNVSAIQAGTFSLATSNFTVSTSGNTYFGAGSNYSGAVIGSTSSTQNYIQWYLGAVGTVRKAYTGFTSATAFSITNEVTSGTLNFLVATGGLFNYTINGVTIGRLSASLGIEADRISLGGTIGSSVNPGFGGLYAARGLQADGAMLLYGNLYGRGKQTGAGKYSTANISADGAIQSQSLRVASVSGTALAANGSVTIGGGGTNAYHSISPDGNYLCQSNYTAGTLQMYAVSASGALTTVGSAVTWASAGPTVWSPDGRYLYCSSVSTGGAGIKSFSVAAGILTAGSTLAPGSVDLPGLAISPDGKYLYCGAYAGTLYAISLSGTTMSSIASVSVAAIIGVCIDPTGRFVYVNSSTGNTVNPFSVNSDGSLAALATTATGSVPYFNTVDPSGRYLYVANNTGGTISAYTIGAAGTVTLIGTYTAGAGTRALKVSANGSTLFATNTSAGSVQSFTINSDGSLSAVSTFTFAGATDLQVDPFGRWLFANNSSTTLQGLTIGAATEILSTTPGTIQARKNIIADKSLLVAGGANIGAPLRVANVSGNSLTAVATYATGAAPYYINSDPTGRYLFVANYTSNTVQVYSVGPSGVATAIGSPTALGGAAVTNCWTPDGKAVFVNNQSSNTVYSYNIDNAGVITTGSAAGVAWGTGNQGLAISPDGKFLYGFSNGTGINVWSVSGSAITSVQTVATSAFGGVVDVASRFLYMSNYLGNVLYVYSIANDGSLTQVQTLTYGSGTNGSYPAISPDGKFLSVGDRAGNQVGQFAIGPTGLISLIGSYASGTGPFTSTFSPDGKYLYVPNYGGLTISLFSVAANGVLTKINDLTVASHPAYVCVDPFGRWAYSGLESGSVMQHMQIGTVTPYLEVGPLAVKAPLLQTGTASGTSTGGTSAATIGAASVGGAGQPATAAQNGWLKMLDSTGATIYIPVWK